MKLKSLFLLLILLSCVPFCKAQIFSGGQQWNVKPIDIDNEQIILFLFLNGNIAFDNNLTGQAVYRDKFDGFDNIGKLKSIGNTTFTYYDRFDREENFGKIKSIGQIQFTYYDSFDMDNIGKLKSVGDIRIAWYDRFDRTELMGKLKSVGDMPVTYYDALDGRERAGKIRSIGNMIFTYYDRFDGYNAGKLKAIGNKFYYGRFDEPLLKRRFMAAMAKIISATPAHCRGITVSLRIKCANKMDTGISTEDTILPRPIPVLGKPLVNSRGGNMVPNRARKAPHFQMTEKLKCCISSTFQKIIMASNPPRTRYMLRFTPGRCRATLFDEYMATV